jgi:hypothetical protein
VDRKDPGWLEWVRTLPCAECGRGPAVPHHLKGDLHQSGAGLKAPDWLAMPLCDACHGMFHSAPEGWRLLQRGWLLETLIKAEHDGLLERTTK